MTIRIDITGQRFGRLVAVERAGTIGRNAAWRCLCDCGQTCVVGLQMLKQEFTKSCGCLRKESAIRNGQTENSRRTAAERMRRRHEARNPNRRPPERSALDDLTAAWPSI